MSKHLQARSKHAAAAAAVHHNSSVTLHVLLHGQACSAAQATVHHFLLIAKLQVVVTDQPHVANQMNAAFGVYPLLVPSLSDATIEELITAARSYAQRMGIWDGEGTGEALMCSVNQAGFLETT